MTKKRIIILSVLCAATIAAIFAVFEGLNLYRYKVSNIISKEGAKHGYYIYPNATMDSVINLISSDYEIKSMYFLKKHINKHSLQRPAVGYYSFDSIVSDQTFLRRLQYGEQTAINISFNNIRTLQQLSSRLAKQFLTDSLSIISLLQDDNYMSQYGMNSSTAICLFFPNTYQMYWTSTPQQIVERMNKEYRHFWNDKRLNKAKEIPLTPIQVAIIASIAEEETNKDFEYPIIAGLYINRYKRNMPLQACPTIKFALGDFSLRRILNRHLEVTSPYNTYKNIGLPPGPIRAARATTLDAVLNYKKSDYLYMCASADFNGTHHFSTNYSEHSHYAKLYQAELNRRKIK